MATLVATLAVQALVSAAVSAATAAIINAMTPPIRQQGPRLGDLKAQSSAYGTFIPNIYGTFQVAPTVMWIENNEIKETGNVDTQGGKGGPSVQVTTYTYTATLALLVSQGEVAGVERLWADSALIYDRSTNASTNSAYATAEFAEAITFYNGTEDQIPHARMEADHPQSPAYRGLAYIVIEDLVLQKFGNRIPQFLAEVTTRPGDVPYVLERFTPKQFAPTDYITTTIPDNSYRPISATAGIIDYELQGNSGAPAIEYDYTADNPPDITATTQHAAASRSIDGYTVAEPETELDQRTPEELKDFSFLSNFSFVSSARNATAWPHRFYRIAGLLRGESIATSYSLISTAAGYPKLETINAPDYLIDRNINESYYYDGIVYFITVQGSGEIGQYLWAVDESGNMLAERKIENFEETEQRKIYKVFANQDGVYALSSVGSGTDIDIVRYDHALETVTGHWQDIGTPASIGALSTDSAAFFVAGSELCTFGTGNNTTIAAATLLESDTAFRQLGTLEIGGNPQDAAQPMNLGGGLFNAGNATIVCGNIFNGATPQLSEVVRGMAVQAGIAAADIDVATLTDEVEGYAVTSLQTMASNLRPLQMAYPFDVVESDWKIKCVRRGAGAPIALTEDDVSARELNAPPPDSLLQERAKEMELPRQVNVKFQNKTRNFDIGEQYQSRQTTQSDNIWQVELPLALDDAQAVKMADVLLYASWLERTVFEFHLGFKHLAIEPTDVLNITLDNVTHSVRVAEMNLGRPGLMQCKGVAQEASHYTSVAVTQIPPPQTQIPIVWAMATKLDFLDIPLLRAGDEGQNPGVYVAAYPASPGWKDQWGGAYLYSTQKTSLAGNNIKPVGFTEKSFVNKQAVYGRVRTYSNLLIKETVIDKANKINVTVTSGDQLFSVDDDNFLSGRNALVLEHIGEILFFKKAILETDGTYTLSHLVRGLFGTRKLGGADGQELIKGKWWLLHPDHVARLSLEEVEIGPQSKGVYYKPITTGAYSIKTRDQVEAHTGRSSWPLKPVHIRSYRNAAGDITIRWIRKTRFDGEWNDGSDVPLNEETEEYAIVLRDFTTGDEKRFITGIIGPQYIYTVADQIADYGSVQSALSIRLYQLSAFTFLAHPAQAGGRTGEPASAIV